MKAGVVFAGRASTAKPVAFLIVSRDFAIGILQPLYQASRPEAGKRAKATIAKAAKAAKDKRLLRQQAQAWVAPRAVFVPATLRDKGPDKPAGGEFGKKPRPPPSSGAPACSKSARKLPKALRQGALEIAADTAERKLGRKLAAKEEAQAAPHSAGPPEVRVLEPDGRS